MKKTRLIFSFLCLILLLSSCDTPINSEPSEELVATQVSLILTETALAATLPPTETAAPPPTQTEPSMEATPTITATATHTPTATEDQNDPAKLLGDAAWREDFTNSSSPWDFDSEQATFKPNNGALVLTAKANPNWHSWYLSNPKLKNAYIEATIQMSNCSGMDRFGLAVRGGGADWDQLYYMGVTCDGQWGFFRMDPGVEITQISAYQAAKPLQTGMDTPHRVGIWMEGADFIFYIDGEEVGTATDTKLSGVGYTGFLIAYANTPGYIVRVDQLSYWNIP